MKRGRCATVRAQVKEGAVFRAGNAHRTVYEQGVLLSCALGTILKRS